MLVDCITFNQFILVNVFLRFVELLLKQGVKHCTSIFSNEEKIPHCSSIAGYYIVVLHLKYLLKQSVMQNPDISFIQLKLANIGTALFYCGSNCPLPFSTYIITALKIDEGGYVWFFINKVKQKQTINNAPFAAQLEFYRKGYPFSMKINGEASIVDPTDKMHDLMGKGINLSTEALAGILLVKVKIETVAYRDLKEQSAWFEPIQRFAGWVKHQLGSSSAPIQWQSSPAMS